MAASPGIPGRMPAALSVSVKEREGSIGIGGAPFVWLGQRVLHTHPTICVGTSNCFPIYSNITDNNLVPSKVYRLTPNMA